MFAVPAWWFNLMMVVAANGCGAGRFVSQRPRLYIANTHPGHPLCPAAQTRRQADIPAYAGQRHRDPLLSHRVRSAIGPLL
ncbi:hypothetical protein KCU95_g99, partial [Aureobasidium melanogenum]